ncbi:MAG: hypothetical protein ACI9LE_001735 [Paraglaciecola sp.]|jgi:hypothetical protein
MPNYVLLDAAKHQKKNILPHTNFNHSAHQHHVPVTINEFVQASTSFPVVFMKDPQEGKFHATALLGIIAGKNLHFTETDWLGTYVPASILRVPFELGPDLQNDKTLTLYVDEESQYLTENQGQALFDGENQTQSLLQVQKVFADYFKDEIATQKFIAQLLDCNLLKEIELVVQYENSSSIKIKGLYTINQSALRELSDALVIDFNKKEYLTAIHAMLASLGQVNRLIKLHNSSEEPKIAGVQMRLDSGEE